MNKFIIKVIMLFAPLMNRWGIDTNQLKIILAIKLTMDVRRPNTFTQAKTNSSKPVNGVNTMSLVISFIMGIFYTMLLAFLKVPLLGHTIYFTLIMVSLTLTLISDFTSVLIDTKDNYIILPRPVSDRTFTVSRILHITIHISKLVFGLTLPAFIYTLIFDGALAGLMFLVEISSATLLSILFVNIIYLIVLKVTTPGKFKDIIAYFQIAFAVLIFVAYNTIPRVLDISAIGKINMIQIKAIYLMPSAWIAGLHELAVNWRYQPEVILPFSVLAILSPLIGIRVVIRYLAPGFNNKLAEISGSLGDKQEAKAHTEIKRTNLRLENMANFFTSSSIEKAGFKIVWLLTSRYREFKVKAYPSFAFIPAYFIFMVFSGKNTLTWSEKWDHLGNGSKYVILIYMTGIILLNILQNVIFSDRYKAAWVYYVTPVRTPGEILSGMYKAIVLKFLCPFILLITLFCISIWGPGVINDVLFGFCNLIIVGILLALFTTNRLPFSEPEGNKSKAGKFTTNLFLMMLMFGMGGIHYFIARWEWLIWVLLFINSGVLWLMLNKYKAQSWQEIQVYQEV
ncbi:hypothetical protein DBR11_10315 [Pedobacter sp. HMWF019]|uniref:hypothetical protein n=1 Tax=Pedobacter sp. HMWF019 TaxID=2056856 RepID=UPI000D37DB3B|nr:hypothetical protein [Pedobacter sp. HMWF019]PTT00219.1 hypothetical protein DBR11_10315 [Pedobacter sp. HMWF019]